jgi:hypothetical protein
MINVPPILSTRDIYDVQAQTSDIISEVQVERRESRILNSASDLAIEPASCLPRHNQVSISPERSTHSREMREPE